MTKTKAAILGAIMLSAMSMQAAELGDKAPELEISKWIKGEPVKVTGDGTYVVEFWATWCGPCKVSIPHLTEMQKKYKDVAFIGISDEKEPLVSKFVEDMGDKMDYRVAIDDNRQTSKAYMAAFEQNGIPHAFVVKDQKIIWHGHPMDRLDETLAEITTGKYDLAKAKVRSQVEALHEKFQEAAFTGDEEGADNLAKEIQEKLGGQDFKGIFQNDKFDPTAEKKMLKVERLKQEYTRAIAQGDKEVEKTAGEQLKTLDPSTSLEDLRGRVETSKLLREYVTAATGDNPKSNAGEIGSRLAEKLAGHPDMANQIAWGILTSDDIIKRDFPLALRIARQASEDSQYKNAQILDTYARALFDSGKKEDAIETQKKAVALAEGAEKEALEKTLKKYQQ